MGRLPLALAQSAGVIRSQKLTYDAFITRLREQPVDEYLVRGGDPYRLHAAQAVLLAVATIEGTDPSARPLLNLLAVLSPEGLPRSLLYAATGRDGSAAAPADVDRTLGRLNDASLISLSIEDQRAVMHRFTQRVIRDRARGDGSSPETIAGAANLLSGALIPDELAWRERAAAADLIQQITALWESTLPESLGAHDTMLTDNLLRLRRWAIRNLILVSDPVRAIELGSAIQSDHERLLGNDHVETQNCRDRVATAHQYAGRLDEAITLFERNLTDRERLLGPDHSDTLTSRNNLALAYRAAGRLDEAITLHQRNLTDRERLLGPNHPDTLTSLGNLAAAYQDAGRVNEAIALQRTQPDRL